MMLKPVMERRLSIDVISSLEMGMKKHVICDSTGTVASFYDLFHQAAVRMMLFT